jgi:hypothetical protein
MADILNYSPLPRSDKLATFCGIVSWTLVPLAWVSPMLVISWHSGLRSLPVASNPQAKDILATTIICSLPILGAFLGSLAVAKNGSRNWVNTLWAATAVFIHICNLLAWAEIEWEFWTG